MIAQPSEETRWTLVTNQQEWGIYLDAVHASSDAHPRFPFLVTEECEGDHEHLFVTVQDATALMVASIGLAKNGPPQNNQQQEKTEDA